ncbi:serine/threonine-protein kinase [Jidongwangia harbinensis]|uniref:serine/threonine-protein kinase n=1 Tax=Jidongwangia harbinensis TaxID=2878561 RepID=UPI001CD9A857|nr:serine/threonine-protein kinase [Jidongwangia harbinensis]MCA2215270.1 serine/threonine protein kinase [Jidongwangia harbinensis]
MAVRRMLVAGRYRLQEPVGTGGMGRVWMAHDEMLDRVVAVKEFVPPQWMSDDEKVRLRDRTLREARSAARIGHPHVVRIYDVVHADGLPWIVMEYVPSRSLHQVVSADGPLSPAATARIGLAVLDALTAAHAAGVLHRDVKPHNVLIGPDGRVVLTDFGLATFVDDGSVTGPGMVVGSPQYVSPERAREGASTVESDLWSLGATLYAAVEGRSPYARETAMATLLALATEPPDPCVRAGDLAPVLNRLLLRDPAARPSAAEVAEGLRAVAGVAAGAGVGVRTGKTGQPLVPAERRRALPEAAPVTPVAVPAERRDPPVPVQRTSPEQSPARPRRYRVAAGALAAAVLAGGGVTGYLVQRDRKPDRNVVGEIVTSAPAPAAGGFSPVACDRQPPADAPRTPQPGAKREVNGWELLSGYSYFAAAGFHLGVPDGWTYEQVGSTFCFRDPDNIRILSVDPARTPSGDPVRACRTEADRLVRAGALPEYQQIGIDEVPLLERAADWEYRYDGREAIRMHATTRWFASGGRAFALGWITRDFEWGQNLAMYQMIQSTFYPDEPADARATPRVS